MANHFLDIFFHPRSVAVVGATNNINTLNYNLLANLVNLNFPGKVYPVNQHTNNILGLRAYPSLKSIKDDIDLAVIAVPAAKMLEIIGDCAARKVKAVVLISGGFAETGEAGKAMQDEIRAVLRKHNIRAIGPNTLSPINTANNLAISFRPIEKLPTGRVSFIFQSGLYDPRLNWLTGEFNLFISKILDLGNKMDVNETDALEYLADDPETGVIAIHMENIAGDARKFMQILKRTCPVKPVIILKSARTPEGARAARSHSGSLVASSDAVFDTMLRQTGAIRANTLEELFDLAKTFEYLYPIKGNRVHIATGPAGEGVIATDLAALNGLSMAQLSPQTQTALRQIFPPWDINPNPFDIGASAQFNDSIRVLQVLMTAVAADPGVDCLALQARLDRYKDPDQFIDLASGIIRRGKPFALWMTVMPHGPNTIVHRLEAHRIPVFPTAERVIRALAALYKYGSRWENSK